MRLFCLKEGSGRLWKSSFIIILTAYIFDFKYIFSKFVINQPTIITMGKGDKKSRRGKINNGSYGKRRPRKNSKATVVSEDQSKK